MNKLKGYKDDLTFEDVTVDFIREYSVYLKKTLGNRDTTTNKNLTTIKIYVNDAVKRGYMSANPFEDIRIKRQRVVPVDYLTEAELTKLTDLYSEKSLPDNLQKALGFFLFMCFTSLHIGDAKQVKMEHITNSTLTYYRKKNRNSKPEPIFIPLSKPAKKIIKQEAGFRVKGLLFDGMYPDQRINKFLKRIAEKVGIDKKVSAKTGRHTFATIYLRREVF
jgi:integrase